MTANPAADPVVVHWELTRHDSEVGLAQLPPAAEVPRWAIENSADVALWCVLRTADELSIICGWEDIPGSVHSVGPLTVFSVDGPLDHSLTGVLAGLLEPLAEVAISILAQSTYDTDWILVPAVQADQAVAVWTAAGHHVLIEGDPA